MCHGQGSARVCPPLIKEAAYTSTTDTDTDTKGSYCSSTTGTMRRALAALAALLLPAAAVPLAATRLRVEYVDKPLTVDVATPRFSWALAHTQRAQAQTAYSIVVTRTFPPPSTVVWDTLVTSNVTLNVPYGGAPLVSDADYMWTVIWLDTTGCVRRADE